VAEGTRASLLACHDRATRHGATMPINRPSCLHFPAMARLVLLFGTSLSILALFADWVSKWNGLCYNLGSSSFIPTTTKHC